MNLKISIIEGVSLILIEVGKVGAVVAYGIELLCSFNCDCYKGIFISNLLMLS